MVFHHPSTAVNYEQEREEVEFAGKETELEDGQSFEEPNVWRTDSAAEGRGCIYTFCLI